MRSGKANWSDLMVAVIVLLFAAGAGIEARERANETRRRVQCASNQRMIGQALLLYSNDNRGAYPRTITDVAPKQNAENLRKIGQAVALGAPPANAGPIPTWGTPYEGNDKLGALADGADPFANDGTKGAEARPRPNDVTAALFMLIRTQDITSEVFICPSTLRTAWDFGGGTNSPIHWSNWQGNAGLREHLSYSYQNGYASRAAIGKGFKFNNAISAEFAIVADLNPGGEGLLKLTAQSSADEVRKNVGNSPNHAFDGQNVLYGDGHVEWQRFPFVGVDRDNIYTFGDSGSNQPTGGEGIAGSPVGPNDSILLPTARDLGVIDAKGNLAPDAQVQTATPQQQDDLKKKLLGTYWRMEGKQTQQLQVADRFLGTNKRAGIAYSIDLVAPDRIGLTLVDPKGGSDAAVVVMTKDGLKISGAPDVNGEWKR